MQTFIAGSRNCNGPDRSFHVVAVGTTQLQETRDKSQQWDTRSHETLTNHRIKWSRVLIEKCTVSISIKISSILWNQIFITGVPFRATAPHPISLLHILSILILSFCLNLHLPTKILYAFLKAPMCATCTTHLPLLDVIILILFGKE